MGDPVCSLIVPTRWFRVAPLALAAALAASVVVPSPAAAQGVPVPTSIIGVLDQFRGLDTSGTIPAITRAIATQITTFPIGSSSGGFTYEWIPSIPLRDRTTHSFGPAFAERAATIGVGQVSLGVNYQHVTYDRFEGQPLTRLMVSSASTMTFDIRADTVVLFANAGLANPFDVSVAVPISSVSVNAEFDVLRPSGPSRFLARTASAAGFGDVLMRAKYRLLPTRRFDNAAATAVAVATDVRLPTGNQDNLLGTGRPLLKVFGVASREFTRFAPHVNVGFGRYLGPVSEGNDGRVSELNENEINYAGGVEVFTPRLTFVADVLGRTITAIDRLAPDESGILRPASTGTLPLVLASVGFKVNLGSTLLVNGQFLLPITRSGLKPSMAPVGGTEYTFSR